MARKPRSKYLGPARKTIKWPPHQTEKPKGETQNWSGEPILIPLARWPNDRTLHGVQEVECCGCGYSHIYSFNVMEKDGDWYLVKRAYGVSDTWPLKVKRARR